MSVVGERVVKEYEHAVVELGAHGGRELVDETEAGGDGEHEVVGEYDVGVGEPVQVAVVAE